MGDLLVDDIVSGQQDVQRVLPGKVTVEAQRHGVAYGRDFFQQRLGKDVEAPCDCLIGLLTKAAK